MKNNGKSILVVDDEKSIVETVKAYLEKEGFIVFTAFDGKEALNIFNLEKPDLIILDLMLPIINGEEVCKKIRETSEVPIIMLTAKINEESKLSGFSLGTDDYLTKPFSPKELVARIYSLFKRVSDNPKNSVFFNNNDLQIDFDAIRVLKKGVQVNLTPNEFKILSILSKKPKRTYSREELIMLLDETSEIYERTIDTYIKNIRNKIEDQKNKYIITVRGFGYKFNL